MGKFALGALAIVLVGGISLFMLSNQKEKILPTPSPTPSQSISPVNNLEQDLKAGGSSYLDENRVYSFLYPNDYTLDTKDPKHIRIYKRGITQRPQSEMSDGVLMVFESIDLAGSSLESLVDTRIKEATMDGTSEVITPKKAIIQNTYPGFSYAIRGLGTSQNLAFQKDKNSNFAVLTTYSVSDPKEKGYQQEVDAVLSLLKLLK